MFQSQQLRKIGRFGVVGETVITCALWSSMVTQELTIDLGFLPLHFPSKCSEAAKFYYVFFEHHLSFTSAKEMPWWHTF